MAQHDADEDAAHTGPSALAESDGVSARRDAIKLSSVVSDLLGVSGLRILWALARGESDPKKLADLGEERLRCSEGHLIDALTGSPQPMHRQLLSLQLERLQLIDERITSAASTGL